MSNYALIDKGLVINIVVWDGDTAVWSPPDGIKAVKIDGVHAEIGDIYDGTNFTEPPPSEPPPPTQAQIIALYEEALSVALDEGAQAWGYDSIVSAASYATSTVAQFKDEAAALIGWRDAVWVWAATEQAAIVGGTQPLPATPTAFVALMPSAPARPTA